jgi:hypothetical protein
LTVPPVGNVVATTVNDAVLPAPTVALDGCVPITILTSGYTVSSASVVIVASVQRTSDFLRMFAIITVK